MMNFEELGLILQQEREKKGLSIEVVMEATKISKTNIIAMESGDQSALPHPVYAKGFVKSYARYLGLDADEMCMVVDREFQEQTDEPREHGYEVSPAAEKAFQEKDNPDSRKKRGVWPLLILLVVLLGIAAFFIFGMKGKGAGVTPKVEVTAEQTDTQPSAEPATPPEATAPDQPVAPEQVDESTPPGTEDQAEVAPVVSDEAAAPSAKEVVGGDAGDAKPAKSAAKEEKSAEAVAGSQEADEAEKTAAVPEKPKYDHVLIIRAITEKGCWVGVWRGTEAKMARDFVLKQGEPLRLMFNHARRIRIGNAAGVTVLYNGKPYALDLDKGNIQTLTFGD